MYRRYTPATLTLIAFILAPSASATVAQDPSAHAQQLIDKGLDYLKSKQNPDGSWGDAKAPPAVTALILKAFAQDPKIGPEAPFVKKGYDKLLTYQVENGGIYKDLLANYNTAIAVSALAAAHNPAYQDRMDRAVKYLKGLQWTTETRPEFSDPSKGKQFVKDEKDPFFGGWGYGGRTGARRPDLSNAQWALDALRDAGLKPDDPAFQNAVKFATHVQNLSETNDQPWAGNDGGFVYSPGGNRQGESMAGEYTGPDGKRLLRSYGSMTYAGLKSFIYAGLSKDDPRVKAAWDWISKNYTFDANPGMDPSDPKASMSGLYYYIHTAARALNEYDQPTITDRQGNKHDWRLDLVNKAASLQKPDGSWVGEKRFMEDNPLITTAYTVLALQQVQHDLKEHPAQK